MRCQSHIVATFKKAKAQSIWPINDPKNEHPICDGEVSLEVDIEGGGPCHCGDYCYCESPEIKVYGRCTKCRNPFFDEELQSHTNYRVRAQIGKLLEIALG